MMEDEEEDEESMEEEPSDREVLSEQGETLMARGQIYVFKLIDRYRYR